MGDDWGRQLGRWTFVVGAIGPFGEIALFERDPSDAFWLTLIACLGVAILMLLRCAWQILGPVSQALGERWKRRIMEGSRDTANPEQ